MNGLTTGVRESNQIPHRISHNPCPVSLFGAESRSVKRRIRTSMIDLGEVLFVPNRLNMTNLSICLG